MKAIRIHQHGGPEVLKIEELPTPKLAAAQVLVKIHAAAMNHMDLWVRNGMPGVKLPLPMILGCEGSGVVVEVGSGVKKIKKGDEVVINPIVSCGQCDRCLEGNDHFCPKFGLLGETEDGVDSEFRAVFERRLIPKPKYVSFEEAAAVPVTFLTAWHMLVDKCQWGGSGGARETLRTVTACGGTQPKVSRSDRTRSTATVLVIAASSGVGSAAVQIAKLFGATVIATAGSDEKLSHAKELGADYLINHTTQSISKEVKKFTEGRGADIVFEHVGKATWNESLRSLAFNGKIVTCGATTGGDVGVNLVHLFIKHQQILGSTMGPSATLSKIFDLVAQKKLRPVIDKVYKFSEVQGAHRRLEGREQFGKIVLAPD